MSNSLFANRISVWENTKLISNNIPAPSNESSKIIYNDKFVCKKQVAKSSIHFFDMDSIDCALQYAPDALILNLADDNFPGGCVSLGSPAQEESLFRRTNLCMSLRVPQLNGIDQIELYPIRDNEAIYSPDITVLKTSESSGWQLIPVGEMPKVAFIACPGLKYPVTEVMDGEPRLVIADVERLKNKIRVIVQTAVLFGHRTIILGALGCGAWRNPIKHVAEIFRDLLCGELDGLVANYYFAILTTDERNMIMRNHSKINSTVKTIDIFKTVFSYCDA